VFDLVAETLDIRSGARDIFGILEAQRRDLGGEVDDSDYVGGRRKSCFGRHDVGNLAVAVSGCASTVGVRALSAATHDDDVSWLLG
jgi:hypothetical protein